MEYTEKIDLYYCLVPEKNVEIITLDGRKLMISVDKIINPNSKVEIKNEGMPINNNEKGILTIKFDIQFPSKII